MRETPGPLVSVIVPVYNSENLLSSLLTSILGQTFRDFEVILVNDGSSDNSLAIIEDFCRHDNRLVCIDQENLGQGKARNRALDRARGTYVCFVDSDDELSETFLEKLVTVIVRTDSDWVHSEFVLIYEGDLTRLPPLVLPPWPINELGTTEKVAVLRRAYYPVGKLFRLDFLRKSGLRFGEGHIYEDVPFVFGAVTLAKKIASIPDPLYRIRVHSSSTTRSSSHNHSEDFQAAVKSVLTDNSSGHGAELVAFLEYVRSRVLLYTLVQRRIGKSSWLRFAGRILHDIEMSLPQEDLKRLPVGFRVPMSLRRLSHPVGGLFFLVLAIVQRVVQELRRVPSLSSVLQKFSRIIKLGLLHREVSKRTTKGMDFNTFFFHGFESHSGTNSEALARVAIDYGFKVVYVAENNCQVPGAINVRKWSRKFWSEYFRAGIHVLETWESLAAPKVEGSFWFQLWHGTPLKRLHLDSEEKELMRHAPAGKAARIKDSLRWDGMLAQNEFSKQQFMRAFNLHSDQIQVFGYPRSDSSVYDFDELPADLREALDIPSEEKLLLYLPTWRDSNQTGTDIDKSWVFRWESVEAKMPDWHLLVKNHPFSNYSLPVAGNRVHRVDGLNTQHLLAIADGLVTDYSSAVFDFLGSGRPFALLMKDLEKYSESRGLYEYVLNELAEFTAKDEQTVLELITNTRTYSSRSNLVSADHGSCFRIIEFLRQASAG